MRNGVYSTRMLATRGWGRAELRRAVRTGTLHRVRRGWYAGPTASPEIVAAVRTGGRLTCLDALRMHGVWTLPTDDVHLRVSSGVAVGRVGPARIHWTSERISPGLDDLERALRMAASCVDLRHLVVVIDSIANRGLLPAERLRSILESSARGRRALALHDPRAESGIETILRLALRRHRLQVQSQVVISGVGRVDFLIGDRLVIEADGFEWHGGRDVFERDRDRDRELVARGYLVIRPSYRRVTNEIDVIVRSILAVVRRREHLWRAIHRAEHSGSGRIVDLSETSTRPAES